MKFQFDKTISEETCFIVSIIWLKESKDAIPWTANRAPDYSVYYGSNYNVSLSTSSQLFSMEEMELQKQVPAGYILTVSVFQHNYCAYKIIN